jgi:hypothetical protein
MQRAKPGTAKLTRQWLAIAERALALAELTLTTALGLLQEAGFKNK